MGPRPHLKTRTLLAQVLAVNLLLIAATVLLATVMVDFHLGTFLRGRELIVLAVALVATLAGNWLLLRRRFQPLEQVVSAMEATDLAAPPRRLAPPRAESDEVRRLQAAFERMIARLEAERREAGRAAIQAQERERLRIARDLHDEVNQALTAVSLRLQATIEHAPLELRDELMETKRLSSQAMDQLLRLARQLRPAILDDHGLLAALHSQVRDFGEQAGITAVFTTRGAPSRLSPEQQLVLYRVTQEGLSNIAQHAGARTVHVELAFGNGTRLTITDDGRGFDFAERRARNGGLGLSGMRERALLVGAAFGVRSRPGGGTTVEVTIPS